MGSTVVRRGALVGSCAISSSRTSVLPPTGTFLYCAARQKTTKNTKPVSSLCKKPLLRRNEPLIDPDFLQNWTAARASHSFLLISTRELPDYLYSVSSIRLLLGDPRLRRSLSGYRPSPVLLGLFFQPLSSPFLPERPWAHPRRGFGFGWAFGEFSPYFPPFSWLLVLFLVLFSWLFFLYPLPFGLPFAVSFGLEIGTLNPHDGLSKTHGGAWSNTKPLEITLGGRALSNDIGRA